MNRSFSFSLARCLASSADELAYGHFMGALFYLREARKSADLSETTATWFADAEAYIMREWAADDARAEAEFDPDYFAAMQAAELGY